MKQISCLETITPDQMETISGGVNFNIDPASALTLANNIINPIAGITDVALNGADAFLKTNGGNFAGGVQIGSVGIIVENVQSNDGTVSVFVGPKS